MALVLCPIETFDSLLGTYLKANATEVRVCSGAAAPADRAAAVAATLAARTGLTGADYTGPEQGDAGVGTRKLRMNAQASIAVSVGGTATCVALCSGTLLLYVTSCTAQVLTGGNTVTIPSWKIEFAAPVGV